MARTQTTALLILAAALPLAGADLSFPVRHEHLRKYCTGTMTVTTEGIAFAGPKHSWRWKYGDIQQLKLAPGRIQVLTYRDRLLELGADREYEFRGALPPALYALWKDRLDQRFVAEVADAGVKPVLAIPAKRLGALGGVQGTLKFADDRIVFDADSRNQSRTWRFTDIDSISASGPFDFTITTFEHARMHYGNRKQFQFQLKEPLSDTSYNQLWREINQKNGRIQ